MNEKEQRKLAAIKRTPWGRFIEGETKRAKEFYFYRFIEYQYLESFFKTKELKATILSQSNDPLEFLPYFHSKREEEIWNDNRKANLFAAICFTRIFSSGAMWGHYADSHRGVCLVFSFPLTRLLNGIMPLEYAIDAAARSYIISDCDNGNLLKVLYKKERPRLSQDVSINSEKRLFSWFLRGFLTKSCDWEYEQEYKLILPSHPVNMHDGALFYGGLWKFFKGVVLGVKSEHSIEEVQRMVKQYKCGNIRVAKARVSDTTYDIIDSKYKDTSSEELDKWYMDKDVILKISQESNYLKRVGDDLVFTEGAIPHGNPDIY